MALTEWAHASCGLFEVEISRRTNKDGKYIEGKHYKSRYSLGYSYCLL